MIELFITPLLLALLAAAAGWRSGKAARYPLRRLASRVRGAWAVLTGRTVAVPVDGFCDDCLARLQLGGCPVLCRECDPVLVAIIGGHEHGGG